VNGALYFAYGSNLGSARMRARVPDARLHGVACAAGFRLAFGKRGADGSGRATLAPEAGELVWGVLWTLPASAWTALDACEPGYARREIETVCAGARLRAETYLAIDPADDPLPVSEAYARLVLDGAREHGLPAQHVARIESLLAVRR
jgi:hypothetical protein